MYTIAEYGRMIADGARMEAYTRALRAAVRPDSVVVDLGAGTGIFALLACRFGARRVYAIEPDDAIEVAQEIARASGCGDRIVFLQEFSTRATLPERAGVIVSDLRGRLPFFELHLPAIVDARERFLVPGGALIPLRDVLWAAVVEAPELYAEVIGPWEQSVRGLDMRAARQMATNSLHKARVAPGQMLLEPKEWFTLDYTTVVSSDAQGRLDWKVARGGVGHGLVLWFNSVLAEGVEFSNAPGQPIQVYRRTFFPWPEPVALESGDRVIVDLAATLVGEDYVWRWDTCVRSREDAGRPKASFQQSTFFGAPLSPGRLRRRAANHEPALDEDGQIVLFVLSLMDGVTPIEHIARRLAEHFPKRFSRWEAALERVAELSQKYSR